MRSLFRLTSTRGVVYALFLLLVGGGAVLVGCYPDPPFLNPERDPLSFPSHFPAIQLSDAQQLTPERVALGKRLFFDKSLSRDSTVSCGSCHRQDIGFTDGLETSIGIEGRRVPRNAMHLANLAWATSQFWDGGVPTLELQVIAPIENPLEMDNTIGEVLNRLGADPTYVAAFTEAYGRGPDLHTLTHAIAAFERTLISDQSPFDRFVTGEDPSALSPAAVRGMTLFFGEKAECFHCHSGNLLSDFTFQNNGLYANYPDAGRFNVTNNPQDIGKFKTPSLRNVAITAPYMHDGSIATLEDVIRHYESGGKGHVNQNPLVRPFALTDQERADLLAFLNALTDTEFLTNPAHRP